MKDFGVLGEGREMNDENHKILNLMEQLEIKKGLIMGNNLNYCFQIFLQIVFKFSCELFSIVCKLQEYVGLFVGDRQVASMEQV